MNTLFLARRGVQGPLRVVEGPFGLDHLLQMRLRVDWDHEGYEGVTTSTIKKYNAQIHTQSAVECILQLVAANRPRLDVAAGFDPGTIASIEAEVPQITYDFSGGGLYGLEQDVRTKEQADHDLRYLLAVAFLDHKSCRPSSRRPHHQARCPVADDQGLRPAQRRLHRPVPAADAGQITVRLTDGATFAHQVQDYPGMPSQPFTWDDVTGKFDQLVAGRIDTGLATQIKDAVRSVENIQVKDLMTLLARVRVS